MFYYIHIYIHVSFCRRGRCREITVLRVKWPKGAFTNSSSASPFLFLFFFQPLPLPRSSKNLRNCYRARNDDDTRNMPPRPYPPCIRIYVVYKCRRGDTFFTHIYIYMCICARNVSLIYTSILVFNLLLQPPQSPPSAKSHECVAFVWIICILFLRTIHHHPIYALHACINYMHCNSPSSHP